MRKFKCHKVVEAFKISEIVKNPSGGWSLLGDPEAFVVTDAWYQEHGPCPGGYFVRGFGIVFKSALEFEGGYTLMEEDGDGSREKELLTEYVNILDDADVGASEESVLDIGGNKWIVRAIQEGTTPLVVEDDITMGGFGWALRQLREGCRVLRRGWNGKDMYLTLIMPGNAMHHGYDMQPCIGMKTADNKMQPGWLASQADMLATDWVWAADVGADSSPDLGVEELELPK